ncbi:MULTISPECIES: AAA family ATPase [Bifidobacterium]|uniref:AAA family ATPase n=1 Tax=Bifidobacterium catenulatum TaxID=1686 RepID=UPI00359C10FF
MCEQIIFFGAPGTGKSHCVDVRTQGTKRIRVTIHPEYTYSDFVGQVLPVSRGGVTSFEFVPGPFTQALKIALADRKGKVSLVLEELSRGNVAAIFGDLFQLLDRGADGTSEYPVNNVNVASQIRETEEWTSGRIDRGQIFLPANLSIYATVNLNDQNVVPMDTAFKRRFEWSYVPITPVAEDNGYKNNPLIQIHTQSETLERDWVDFYQALDRMIVDRNQGLSQNEDRQVGQFFLKFSEEDIRNSRSPEPETKKNAATNINRLIRNKLLMYLWQDVQPRSMMTTNAATLFLPSISSFQELNERSKNEGQVFSDLFINDFLKH